ncbi:lachesin-like isoform X2 [Coccinella septempunctata]|uniref:lachesin-like isoform X2 n=1 Tax=Coccinella septempunctata TaxID=41139 RepID=UPI001D096727|nr:lachesin-like isoform X2 [Coccinella septempunctata]
MTAERNVFRAITALFALAGCRMGYSKILDSPSFAEPIQNTTVAVGREAILTCVVENLNPYKVAWLRVDTQTILTIQGHVITKNHRIGVTHSEQKTWYLHIKEVKESDKGWYMCQINTDPMKSQVGYLDVVVSPDILDTRTSPDLIVDEGSNVSLHCSARGSPEPNITWKREDGQMIPQGPDNYVASATGSPLNISKVKRDHMGPYLCIASNGIPPSISKRIMLIVQFPPTIWIEYQLVGAYENQEVVLECHCEAFPKSINYWTRDRGEIISHSNKYVPELIEDGYRTHMKLTLRYLIEPDDYGIYKCVSKNSVGEMEGTINVYKIPDPNSKTVGLISGKGSSKHPKDTTYQQGKSTKDGKNLLYHENEVRDNSSPRTIISRFTVVTILLFHLWSIN